MKAACDKTRPACSRCAAKATECHYPANTPRATPSDSQHGADASAERHKMTLTSVADPGIVDSIQEASHGDHVLLDGALALPDHDFTQPRGDFLEWDGAEIALPDFLNTQTNSPRLSPESPFQQPVSSAFQVQQGLSTPESSIPNSPSSSIRSLIQRPNTQRGPQRIASLILHTLKSYPVMMLRHNTLPPFVHPCLLSLDIESVHMEPLTNCISLVHMISSDVRGSRKLFWKNVRMECEHWTVEVC